jgi:hypothetical protein
LKNDKRYVVTQAQVQEIKKHRFQKSRVRCSEDFLSAKYSLSFFPLYISEWQLSQLLKIKDFDHLFIDGTFRLSPPGFSQLYTFFKKS